MPVSLSLRRNLLVAIMAPLSVISVIGTAFDYRLARETADATFDLSLTEAALDLAAHAHDNELHPGTELATEAEAMLRSNGADVRYFSVSDESGKWLVGDADLPPITRSVPITPSGKPYLFDSRFRDQRVRVALYRLDARHGQFIITVAETINRRLLVSGRILTAMVLPGLVLLLAILGAVYFGVRRGLARLDQVESEIARRSPRDLREIDVSAAPEEVRPTLSRLNELFELLRQAAVAQQRFLANAAHQLRTPLTGLQTQIELAVGEGRFVSESERLVRINEAIARIDRLVDRLLTYARTENTSQLNPSFEPVALHELVEQSASLFIDQALKKDIDLGFDVQPATVQGVTWMLREALANLIDNALRYTPSGGIVTVNCSQTASACTLTVEDNGPGIPASQREQVLDRFYRLPGASGDGSGLGLAIVREIATLHGGTLRLEDARGGGLRFSMIFPIGHADTSHGPGGS